MEEPQTQNRQDLCHRCLEPVPPKLSRCPRCGESIQRPGNIRKMLAIFGLLMFVVIAAVAFRLMQSSGAPAAANDDQQHKEAPPPEKKPALGQ
jgi:uncharacterized paraquat-inducible protein A